MGRVVTEAGDLGRALQAADLERVDLAILNLDATADMRAWARLRLAHPDVQMIGLTSGQNRQVLLRAVAAGVTALLPASLAPQALIRLLPRALSQGLYLHPSLEPRVRLALAQPPDGETIQAGPLSLDLSRRTVTLEGQPIPLSPLEFDVLAYLALAERPVGVDELLEMVWGAARAEGGTPEQVWQCIRRLRRKLEGDPAHPRLLRTLRGRGYLLTAPAGAARRARQGVSGPGTLPRPIIRTERDRKPSATEVFQERAMMKRSGLLRAAVGVAGLLLVGLLAFGLARLGPVLAPEAERPVWEPGTFWRYECAAAEPALVIQWTREELVLGEVTERGVDLYLALQRSHFDDSPLVETVLHDRRTLSAVPIEFLDQAEAYAWLEFPLRVGKRWPAGPDMTAEVVGVERLDLPVGRVTAHRVEFRDPEGRTQVIWYAEKVGHMVRARSPEGECTLTAWGRKDLATALEPFLADLERMAKSQPAEAWTVLFTLERYRVARDQVEMLRAELLANG